MNTESAIPNSLQPPQQTDMSRATAQRLHRAVELARSDWSYLSSLTGGGPIDELEQQFASFTGASHCLALSSCTSAIHAALLACGVRRGDEVIVPAYTWGQTVAPVLHIGAVPVFADIDPETCTLAPDEIDRLVSGNTRCIIVAHLFGHPADMHAICTKADRHDLSVIEDCAQAVGACIDGQHVGTFGDAGCFSLGRGKGISGGEGGLLVTGTADIYERAVFFTQHPLRQHFEIGTDLRDDIDEFGHNFRIHPLAAAMALGYLEGIHERLVRRSSFYRQLSGLLGKLPGMRTVSVRNGCTHSYYSYSPTYDVRLLPDGSPLARAEYVSILRACGIPITDDPVMTPLHQRNGLRVIAGAYGVDLLPQDAEHGDPCPEATRRARETGLIMPRWLPELENALPHVASATQNATEVLASGMLSTRLGLPSMCHE